MPHNAPSMERRWVSLRCRLWAVRKSSIDRGGLVKASGKLPQGSLDESGQLSTDHRMQAGDAGSRLHSPGLDRGNQIA